MAYRLGLDIGTNSIGWCILELDGAGEPVSVTAAGARIYTDGRNPTDGTSLASARRAARAMRRNNDRYLLRRDDLLTALIELGLMPEGEAARKALEGLDPYELRSKALDGPLPPHHLGRALFHLHQRRGFKSNRKTDQAAAKEAGVTKLAIEETQRRMIESGARSFGDYLWRRRRKGKTVLARPGNNIYPSREMVTAEFNAIHAVQSEMLNAEGWDRLHKVMFRQRDLKKPLVGRCSLEPDDERAPRALPVAQEFRMLQELANLRIQVPGQPDRSLDMDQRDRLLAALKTTAKLTAAKMIKMLKLPGDTGFNLLSEARDDLKGDETAAVLAHKKRFGAAWHGFTPERQAEIVEHMLTAQDEQALAAHARQEWGLDPEAAAAVASAWLPDGHASVGRKALAKLLPIMRDQVLTYGEAVTEADYRDLPPREHLPRLPAYAQLLDRYVVDGRIGNPTVHIGLNQLRRVVNELIDEYGKPAQIVVELARDLKQSEKDKEKLRKRQSQDKKRNDELRAELAAAQKTETPDAMQRLKLWRELGPVEARCCPYTGTPITWEMALSAVVEIDHILPFSQSFDDGLANKTLCLREANRFKQKRTPHEAFHTNPPPYNYAAILARAVRMESNKAWRFQPDAAERMMRDNDFLARHLNETRYLSRLAREYLVALGADVWVLPGKMTEKLRRRWGLNSLLGDHNRHSGEDAEKNRADHRHHAIDAVVVAMTDRSLLQKIQRAAAEENCERLIDAMPRDPWPGFRAEVKAALDRAVVSHKADHGAQGQLHNETALGLVGEADAKGMQTVVARKPLASMKPGELEKIRDEALRERLTALWEEMKPQDKDQKKDEKKAWLNFAAAAERKWGLRKLRLLDRMKGLAAIKDKSGNAYKGYKKDSNHCVDIYCDARGKWRDEVIPMFDVNQPDFSPSWSSQPDNRKVMRLFKNDMLAIEDDGGRRYMRVVKFSEGRISLAEHNEGGSLKARDADKDDPFSYLTASASRLQSMRARKLRVDEIGRVHGLARADTPAS